MKKFLCLVCSLFLTTVAAKADFAEHYNAGQQYLTQYQYSSAISEFKKALRINYMDDSARIGLVNSYLARGTYYANNDKDWEDSANDYRAALFYLRYYPISNQDVQNTSGGIENATQNLNQCLAILKFSTSPSSRYKKAKDLRLQGLFAEAGYEFEQTLSDPALQKNAYEQIGDVMKVLGNDQKTYEYYKKAIALNPDNGDLRLKYARTLDKQGLKDEAVKEYNNALVNGGNDPETLYALERIYRQKLDQMPNDPATLTSLGAILQKENKLDEALQDYSQASQLDPTNVTTRLNVGTLYQQKKSYDSAIAAYESILTTYPNHIEANLYKAQCLGLMGHTDESIAAYSKVLNMQPNNKLAKSMLFDTIKSTMTPSDAMTCLSKNLALDPGMIDNIYNYAIDLHKQNKFDDAIAYYKEVLKVRSNVPEIYLNLAIAYKQKGDVAQSKQILLEAKAKFPENKQISDTLLAMQDEALGAKFDEASKDFQNGNFQKALEVYQSIQPASFDSLNGIAATYKALNNDTQAIEYYKKALALKSDSDVAYYIGVLYSEKENWQDSKVYLKKALEINPKNTKAKDLMGTVIEQANVKSVDNAIAFYDKGNYNAAMQIFNQVLTEDPKNAYALYYKGLILDGQKKYTAAIVEYKKAIQYNPDLTTIYYLLALDYDNLTQFKTALANYKKYVSVTAESNEYKTYAQARAKELKKYE